MDLADSESTVTSLDENTENFCDNPTRDTLADGIICLFISTVDQLQERVKATRSTQNQLKQNLNTLSAKLKAIDKLQQTPAPLDDYVRKLINVKHKVTVLFNVLNSAQDRLNRVRAQVELENTRRKVLMEKEKEAAANSTMTSSSSTGAGTAIN